MDDMDKLLSVAMLIAVLGIVITLVDTGLSHPLAADDALNQCIERGYQTYDSFEKVFLSTQALGVRCSEPTYSQIEISDEKVVPVKIIK